MPAYHQYTLGKQTLSELKAIYHKDPKTIRKYFDQTRPITGKIKPLRPPINAIIDATFFGRTQGILICRANGKNVFWKMIVTEKVVEYEQLLHDLVLCGIRFSAFVIDGRRGILQLLLRKFPQVPIQLCHFHQVQVVTRYLSRRPKLAAGQELRQITLRLSKTDQLTFQSQLQAWHERWQTFLQEKTMEIGKKRWHYRHRRVRSAYRSLQTNLPWLFTYQDYPELHIPNTTNSCDGSFAHWKHKVRLHRGLRKDRKTKMIHFLLENS